ncbi:MAG TPA: phosphatidate cytidylyltransferase [Dongiaceae bacterium]|nr:phosphatidate cytidylyltransferase [Dongiaceae bacterium]
MAPPVDAPGTGLTNLQKRLISAAVLLPLVTAAIYFGHPLFTLFIAAFAAAAAWEWARIVANRKVAGQVTAVPTASTDRWGLSATLGVVTAALAVLLAGFGGYAGLALIAVAVGGIATFASGVFRDSKLAAWSLLGVLYVAIPATALVLVRNDPEWGMATLLWIIALVVAADTGGYIAGRSIGGPKLAPRISPNKTWAGLGGAVAGAALIGFLTGFIVNHTNVWLLVPLSAVLGIVEQAGDLVESALKRHFGVKDASHIIPGHGGVLDRVDGLLAVAVAVLLIGVWAGRSVLTWS